MSSTNPTSKRKGVVLGVALFVLLTLILTQSSVHPDQQVTNVQPALLAMAAAAFGLSSASIMAAPAVS